ncbi:MAG: hypothetical protein A2269_09470 [Lentisphaerae bacterium RIFOXYA12_FULL_60_10]|nr:MAG: hypothetical protein A2269_09470 [Lentisphaerae bacterium RIFOXYA12_FULL_60_10]
MNHQAEACVKDWAEAGMTLAMSPNYGSTPGHVKRMGAILDAAAAADIRVILGHNAGYWPTLTDHGEAAYRRTFTKAVKELGHHPAVFGFHVGDEPGAAQFADACKAHRIQKELAPGLSPFLNLLPMYQGIASRIGYQSWDRYLDDYVAFAQPPLLCYDCYAQMNPDPDSDAAGYWGWQMYFDNLWTFWQAGRRHHLDYWTTLLSTGHFRYRCPTENDLRWQVNTAVASGAKGLLWFFLYMREPQDNYRVAPIDEHWERSETYEWLSRVCRTFLKWHAPVLLESELVTACHVGKSWGPWPKFDGTGRVVQAQSSTGTPLILSQFKHAGGADYLCVVNNSQTLNTYAELVVRGNHPKLHRVGWQGSETSLIDSTGQGAEHGSDYITIRRWLAPGQMEMFRIDEA